jgi:hypothetical protein
MTLEQAKQARDKYSKIIGMTSPLGMDIIDVIAEPLGIGEKFRTKYIELLRELETVSNDKLLQSFTADTYQVTAVLDYDGGLTNLAFDDISEYSSLI